jgi:predicted amidohydrolase
MINNYFKTKKYLIIFELIIIIFISCAKFSEIPEGLMEMYGCPLGYDDSSAKNRLKAVAACINISSEKADNISNIESTIKKIMNEKPDTQLIVFGELITGWYYKSDDPKAYQEKIAESIPGVTTNSIGILSNSYNIYIAFGMTELSNNNLYNSLVLLNPDGNIEKVHRKIFLADVDILSGFTAGNDITIVNINGIKIGMLICKEVRDDDLIDKYLNEKIDILIHSNSFVGNYDYDVDFVAKRFNCWVISSSRCNVENSYIYNGVYYISAPSGIIKSGKTAHGGNGYSYYDLGIN